MKEKQFVPVKAAGVVPSAYGCTVFLSADGKIFAVGMDESKYDNIKFAIENTRCDRPTTFEFIRDLLEAMECRMLRADFYAERDGVFFMRATMSVKTGGENRITTIDARPSDAIPLALRCNAGMFIDAEVLERLQDMSDTFDNLKAKLL